MTHFSDPSRYEAPDPDWEDRIREEEAAREADYPIACSCGFFGMRLDCRRGECPNCGERVKREILTGGN